MDISQAKARLDDIKKSTAPSLHRSNTAAHPKTLIKELCVIIEFLLDKIDHIKDPPITVLHKRFPGDPGTEIGPDFAPPPFSPPNLPMPELPPINPLRKGNAGDAE